MPTVVSSIRIPEDVWITLACASEDSGVSVNEIVVVALRRELDMEAPPIHSLLDQVRRFVRDLSDLSLIHI